MGKFILVIGPSGSGKGTLIHHARPLFPELVYPKSCTTRAKRAGEKDGEHYYFLELEDFKARVARGEFLEWAEYGGNFYGTLSAEVIPALSEGKLALKELEVQGVRQIREKLPKEQLAVVFINAGSWEEMEARIRARAPMPEDELLKRKLRYEDEMSYMKEADFVIENHLGGVETAKKEFERIIRSLVS
ncbi:MAG: guanylate kinase [Patescibacteria group bacterium]|nr:guanylate kinase [Patescibacteria group bacterium]